MTAGTGPPSRDDVPYRNEVVLVGRLAAAAAHRVLPSGDEIVGFRIVVSRPATHSAAGAPATTSRALVDTVNCTAWSAASRRTALAAGPQDVLEVTGSLRRRFWRSHGGAASRYDVEVARIRRLRKARS